MRYLAMCFVLGAAVFAPSSAALAHEPGSYESPIVEQRVKRFKQTGSDIQAIFKKHLANKDFAAIEEAALNMAGWGKNMPATFPVGSTSVGANPAIWENFTDFEAKSEAFHQAAMLLKEGVLSRDVDVIKSLAGAVGGTCKSCHKSYRIKH